MYTFMPSWSSTAVLIMEYVLAWRLPVPVDLFGIMCPLIAGRAVYGTEKNKILAVPNHSKLYTGTCLYSVHIMKMTRA